MTRGLTLLIAFVVAYAIIRGVYAATGFRPTREFGLPLGYLVELALWAIVLLAVAWVLAKAWPPARG